MSTLKDRLTEAIPSELEDQESSLYTYEILTYPADYTLEVLVGHWGKFITVPEEQRNFIWTQNQSSKLIESFLMGLPVPPVYFYQKAGETKLQVVDGLQRLLSVVYFYSGLFGEKGTPGKKVPVFSLTGLHKKSPYNDKTYDWLKANDEQAFDKIQNSVLRSFVMKQLQPKDNTSIYQVFERLNSGGMVLQGQEIRNCIYTGPFNNLLKKLNSYPAWRQVLGTKVQDKRMRDMELMLRFFALYSDLAHYKKPMKEFLNDFMETHRYIAVDKAQTWEDLFKRTCDAVVAYLGHKPFVLVRGLNVAVYDSLFVAFAKNIDSMYPVRGISGNLIAPVVTEVEKADKRARLDTLLADEDYIKQVSSATTDDQVVKSRIKKAELIMFE